MGILYKSIEGAQGDCEAEVFQVSNDDTAVAQRWLKDKQPEEKTNTDCLVKEQEKEYQTRSPSLAIEFTKPIGMLEFFGWHASIKQRMLEPVMVKCIFLRYYKSIVGNKLWRLDDVTLKVVLYRNMGFNESGEYNKTFIGSGVGAGLMLALHGFEFEVEPIGDHTFEVEH
nr:retrotransposon protein, putative, Ty1-copia subclass [Tanacetum cinerariifolium]